MSICSNSQAFIKHPILSQKKGANPTHSGCGTAKRRPPSTLSRAHRARSQWAWWIKKFRGFQLQRRAQTRLSFCTFRSLVSMVKRQHLFRDEECQRILDSNLSDWFRFVNKFFCRFRMTLLLVAVAGCVTPHQARLNYIAAHPDLTSAEHDDILYHYADLQEVELKRQIREARANFEKELEPDRLEAEQKNKAWNDARDSYLENPKNPPAIQNAIKENKIVIGMTEEQVRLSWREPSRVTETVSSLGRTEMWDYGGSSVLIFRDGILASWSITSNR